MMMKTYKKYLASQSTDPLNPTTLDTVESVDPVLLDLFDKCYTAKKDTQSLTLAEMTDELYKILVRDVYPGLAGDSDSTITNYADYCLSQSYNQEFSGVFGLDTKYNKLHDDRKAAKYALDKTDACLIQIIATISTYVELLDYQSSFLEMTAKDESSPYFTKYAEQRISSPEAKLQAIFGKFDSIASPDIERFVKSDGEEINCLIDAIKYAYYKVHDKYENYCAAEVIVCDTDKNIDNTTSSANLKRVGFRDFEDA